MNNVCGRTKTESCNSFTYLAHSDYRQCLPKTVCDLANLVWTNNVLNVVGTVPRQLYHTIGVEMRPARLLQCMILLDRSADLSFLVRTFEMNLVNNSPTRTYNLLSERALIVSFTTLVVELPKYHSPTWAYGFLQPHDGAGFSNHTVRLSSRARGLSCLEIQTIIFCLRAPQQLADPEW